MRGLIGIIMFVGVLVATEPAAAQSVRYKVIVNANNPAAVLMASELSRIYLGTANVWPDRTMVLAVDQNSSSPVHEAFTREVIGKDSVALSHYWEQAIFSGRAVPPSVLANDLDVVDFVRRNPGAIGYVSATTVLGLAVKELRIVP
jgi:ABC-type phosphate transport system substrate-binding protein